MPYLTPDGQAGIIPVLAFVPDTLLPSFVGAIACLLCPENWEQFGTLTVAETVDLASAVVAGIVENPDLNTMPSFIGAILERTADQNLPSQSASYINVNSLIASSGVTVDLVSNATCVTIGPGNGGVYWVSYSVRVLNNGHPYSWATSLELNGSSWPGRFDGAHGTGETSQMAVMSFPLLLSEGNEICLMGQQTSGFTWTVDRVSLSIVRVSDSPE